MTLSSSTRFVADAMPLRPELERAARRYTRNSQDAEDLVAETYAKAWAGFGSFDAGTNLRAWMYRIMVNTWISTHRKVERRPQETLTDEFTDAQLAAVNRRTPTVASAETQALTRLPNDDIARAMRTLPHTLQAVVYYADICQLPYKEIAAIERIPLGTVMSRVHRARRQLRLGLLSPTVPDRRVPTTAHHPATSMTASANWRGASCGTSCPMPSRTRWEYLPVN